MTVGSLFSGIGGFDLGFERAGFDIKWQVEIDDYANHVLAKHWPTVRRYPDVRTCGADTLESVDVICGGFPCQPHSLAGARGGASDERDLWPEFARIVRELGPRWVVAENVPGLLSSDAGRFFGTVLGDLAAAGYDAEWDCISAADAGAPHLRERIWIVAYPPHLGQQWCWSSRNGRHGSANGDPDVANTESGARQRAPQRQAGHVALSGEDVADPQRSGHASTGPRIFGICSAAEVDREANLSLANSLTNDWCIEPDVGRVAHGVSARVDRLCGLGNAIVPQIAEWIARRITEAEVSIDVE